MDAPFRCIKYRFFEIVHSPYTFDHRHVPPSSTDPRQPCLAFQRLNDMFLALTARPVVALYTHQ